MMFSNLLYSIPEEKQYLVFLISSGVISIIGIGYVIYEHFKGWED